MEAALVVLDLNMPGISGQELLREIKESHPRTSVVMLTAVRDLETAVDCMREGACDYLVKPVMHPRLLTAVATALDQRRVSEAVSAIELSPVPERLRHEEEFAGIVTASDAIRSLFRYVEAIAPTSLPVLITGETGTGKELFARAIHGVSGRKGPFVALNIAGLDDLQFSDSLFGHLRGAYTGADNVRDGLTATAANGTLFLDEIGDLRGESQVKLLRLLQENEFYPLGADSPRRCTARIVVATNRNLEKLVAEGTFRNDLYYRLRTHRVVIPPLRNRDGDLSLLIDHFIADAARALGKKRPYHPPELVTLLGGYGFPGNVRELQMMVFDAVARTTSGKLSLETFKEYLGHSRDASPIPPRSGEKLHRHHLRPFPNFGGSGVAPDRQGPRAGQREPGDRRVNARCLPPGPQQKAVQSAPEKTDHRSLIPKTPATSVAPVQNFSPPFPPLPPRTPRHHPIV